MIISGLSTTDLAAMPANYEQWGKLIKQWATGEDRLQIPSKSFPVPKDDDLAELQRQLDDAQTNIKLPGRVKKLKVIVTDEETLVVLVPPAAFIKKSENDLAKPDGGTKYPLPAFYEQAFQATLNLPTPEMRLAFHSKRVGDYTIANCQ